MGIFDRVERVVEDSVNGAFSKVFRSTLKPVDLTASINRAMDDGIQEFEANRIICPNDFTVHLSIEDFDRFQKSGLQVMAQELAQAALSHAESEQYVLAGKINVTLEEDSSLRPGEVKTNACAVNSAVAPAFDHAASTSHPLLQVGETLWRLIDDITVIGRGQEADIVIDDSSVSRKHAEIRITPGAVLLTDLSSTNGTFVEGHRITACQLVDGNEITLGRTSVSFWSSEEEDGQ
ncbi:FHA domain-containing protein [Actinomycetaceae bacterium TAE3-ERU4]|nr:FHA domain-containing protein [Actinomycetaceae bacterium TAE3-ERU4]